MIERTARQIVFLPECLTPSYVQTDFAGLLEFTTRQVRITRVYRPQMWVTALATHFLYCFTLLLGFLLAFELTLASRPAFHVTTLLVLTMLLAAIRGALRVVGVTEALPSLRSLVMSQAWIYILLPAMVPFLYLLNFFASLFGRRLKWRGIEYELISRDQTRVVSP